jgi:hypothetical protein
MRRTPFGEIYPASAFKLMHETSENPANNLSLNLVFLLLIVFLLEGTPIPSVNECLYLLLPLKQWNSNFLLNDWTLTPVWYNHLVFDSFLAPFTAVFSLQMIGWCGRIACWILGLLAIFRVTSHFQIPRWMTSIAVCLWLIEGQSIAGGEWLFGTFEAKDIAYPLLLLSLDGFIRGRPTMAAILLGFSFSFHPAVGMWGALSVGLTLIAMGTSVRKLSSIIGCVFLCSLPGLIPLFIEMHQDAAHTMADWKFLTLVRMPHHLDPLSWPARSILLMHIMLLFNWFHWRTNKESQALRWLVGFQIAAAVFFDGGILARILGRYDLLNLMPFRLFPPIVMLFFFLSVFHAYYNSNRRTVTPLAAGLGLLALLGLKDPVGVLADKSRETYKSWRAPKDDLAKTFEWLSKNSPNGKVVILPPWRADSFYLAQRAQVANWQAVPVGRAREWRERMEAMTGKDWEQTRGESLLQKMEQSYALLTLAQIRDMAAKYNCSYLVSNSDYPLTTLFRSGTYKIYLLEELRSTPDK